MRALTCAVEAVASETRLATTFIGTVSVDAISTQWMTQIIKGLTLIDVYKPSKKKKQELS